MEDNQLVLAFKQLIKLIIDADKDLAKLINSETIARNDDIEDLISRITAEEQYRSNSDEELKEKIYNLVTSLNTEITERQTGISNLNKKINDKKLNYLHQVSNALINENQVICMENLNVKGMIKNGNGLDSGV